MRWYLHRRRRVLTIAVIGVLLLYAVAFCLIRQRVHISDGWNANSNHRSIDVYYFSESQAANRFWYYLFWPLHRAVGYPEEVLQQKDWHSPVYLRELTVLADHLEIR